MQESPFYEHVIQRGLEQGQTREKQETILKLLRHQFGDIPDSLATHITTLSYISALDDLFDQVLDAESLDDIDW